MKKYTLIILFVVLGLAVNAHAIPNLQLDISGGSYDLTSETIVASSNPFKLYAYLIPDRKNTLTDSYYISAGVIPKIGPIGANLGSFSINGQTIDVTSDMVYGVPPLENIVSLQGWDKGDLPRHGIYETYFAEFEFQFNSSSQISPYNTQDRAKSDGSIPATGSGMYYVEFTIDTSLLTAGYNIHFDLYNTALKCGGDIDITQFAPFSHDAQSNGHKVPEPGTFLLLGGGLLISVIGFGFYNRKKIKK